MAHSHTHSVNAARAGGTPSSRSAAGQVGPRLHVAPRGNPYYPHPSGGIRGSTTGQEGRLRRQHQALGRYAWEAALYLCVLCRVRCFVCYRPLLLLPVARVGPCAHSHSLAQQLSVVSRALIRIRVHVHVMYSWGRGVSWNVACGVGVGVCESGGGGGSGMSVSYVLARLFSAIVLIVRYTSIRYTQRNWLQLLSDIYGSCSCAAQGNTITITCRARHTDLGANQMIYKLRPPHRNGRRTRQTDLVPPRHLSGWVSLPAPACYGLGN